LAEEKPQPKLNFMYFSINEYIAWNLINFRKTHGRMTSFFPKMRFSDLRGPRWKFLGMFTLNRDPSPSRVFATKIIRLYIFCLCG